MSTKKPAGDAAGSQYGKAKLRFVASAIVTLPEGQSNRSPLERLHWLTRMKGDMAITISALKVACCLAEHCNSKSGQCNPTQKLIEAETRLSERAVRLAISILKKRGYIRAHKRGKANSYDLLDSDRGGE